MREQGLPDNFYNDEVRPAFNMESGLVFLTNYDYQVCMMNGDKLELFYSTPYENHEGFLDELLEYYDDMHDDDKEFINNIRQ